MTTAGTMQITLPSDREIAMTRTFDAPRSLVWDAWTKPELLKRWLGVRNDWSFAVCEIDLRVGGAYRFVWRGPQGDMGMGGVYSEVAPPERLVSTEKFDHAWYPGEATNEIVLLEREGKTVCATIVRYESKEARDGVLQSGMDQGMSEGFDKLDEVLAAEVQK